MRRAVGIGCGVLGLGAACTLTTSLDGYSEPRAGEVDASDTTTTDAPTTETPDAEAGASITPVIVTSGAGIPFAAGAAQQSHLHYAKNAKLWVFFYETASSAGRLETRVSRDFVTWSDGGGVDLPEPHPGDGRSFSVAYADIGGKDVFHVGVSVKASNTNRAFLHARATLANDAVSFSLPIELGRTTAPVALLDPDGPAVSVIAGGTVIDLSGFYSVDAGTSRIGNVNAWRSSQPETGGAWTPGFSGPVEVEVVPMNCNARSLVPIGTGALAVWEAGDEEPSPTALRSAGFEGSWQAAQAVGFVAAPFHTNDWGVAVALASGTAHAVRFASTFEHRVRTGSTWTEGKTMPPLAFSSGKGVVVLADGDAITTFVIDGAIRSSSLSSSGWSSWTEVVAATDKPRSGLTGYAGPGGVGLVWVETNGVALDVVAAKIR